LALSIRLLASLRKRREPRLGRPVKAVGGSGGDVGILLIYPFYSN